MTSTNGNGSASNGNGKPPISEEMLRLLIANATSDRTQFFRQLLDPRRDYDNECGYPKGLVTPQNYQDLYDREAIAARVVECEPRESWQVTPTVFEDEHSDKVTPFEEAWDGLSQQIMGEDNWYQDESGSPVWEYLQRADEQSGIGHFGVLLLGFDDVKDNDLTQPVKPGKGRKILYMRVFPEALAQITRFETDWKSPRYGQPTEYLLTFNDPNDQYTSGIGLTTATVNVHWSRCIHLPGDRAASEVFGVPRMKPVLNRLMDLRKLYGGSAEMYWRGAFPGLSFETHPQLGGQVEIDRGAMRDMVEEYSNGLQRFLLTSGMSAKTMSPTVVDPSQQIAIQLEAICIKLGIPVRIFKGSERGELASSQDDAAWNDRKRQRQNRYITPRIIIPFVNRLIMAGVLPQPGNPGKGKKGQTTNRLIYNAKGQQVGVQTVSGYSVVWPDLESIGEQEKVTIAASRTQAMVQYISGGCNTLVAPQDYLTRFLGFDEEEADAILESAEKYQEEHPPAPPPGAPPGAPPEEGGMPPEDGSAPPDDGSAPDESAPPDEGGDTGEPSDEEQQQEIQDEEETTNMDRQANWRQVSDASHRIAHYWQRMIEGWKLGLDSLTNAPPGIDPSLNAFCPTGIGGGNDNSCSSRNPSGVDLKALMIKGNGSKENPYRCGANIKAAAKLLAAGGHIELAQPEQVATLVDKLGKMINKAIAKGTTPPHFDLCKVSAPGSNLFCQESLGIPRVQMPQMRGLPVEGTYAATLPASKKTGKVDLSAQFIDHLRSQGIGVKTTEIRVSHLRASQAEIVGSRVAQLVQETQAGDRDLREKPIFVTRDNYIVDGHHHWAADIAVSMAKGKDWKIPVHVLDMDIGKALDMANEYTKKMGLAPKSGSAAPATNQWGEVENCGGPGGTPGPCDSGGDKPKKMAGHVLVPGVVSVKRHPDYKFNGTLIAKLTNGDEHHFFFDRQSAGYYHANHSEPGNTTGYLGSMKSEVLTRLVERASHLTPNVKGSTTNRRRGGRIVRGFGWTRWEPLSNTLQPGNDEQRKAIFASLEDEGKGGDAKPAKLIHTITKVASTDGWSGPRWHVGSKQFVSAKDAKAHVASLKNTHADAMAEAGNHRAFSKEVYGDYRKSQDHRYRQMAESATIQAGRLESLAHASKGATSTEHLQTFRDAVDRLIKEKPEKGSVNDHEHGALVKHLTGVSNTWQPVSESVFNYSPDQARDE